MEGVLRPHHGWAGAGDWNLRLRENMVSPVKIIYIGR